MTQQAGEKREGIGPVARAVSALLVPFILIFGLHVMASSHSEPGGAFEAGVIIAAAYVLSMLAFGRGAVASVRGLMLLTCLGAVVVIGVSFAGLLLGCDLLTNKSCCTLCGMKPALYMEFGITLSAASAILLLVLAMSNTKVPPGGKDDEFQSAVED